MTRSTAALVFAVLTLVGVTFYAVSRPTPDDKIALCPAGQHAEYIDSGRDENGQIVVAIGCEKNGAHP